ncbi:choed [Popillia japonica]|uniref:Choed n=1 Tax=Popillia japonica TaxID=7064 RepID=A0AAW1LAT9_POPJA
MSGELLQCYNRGCGQKYHADKNAEDSCRHHPGEPFFHDAYKGWSCCNRKCTDFTEFLNIRGCTVSKHSNIKPIEPEKPVQSIPDVEIVEVKPVQPAMKRPPFNTPMTTMNPEIAPSVKQNISVSSENTTNANSSEVTVGTSCKNRGCTTSYEGPTSDSSTCTYHPGVPIFHEVKLDVRQDNIYGRKKMTTSVIKLSPVRLYANLVFPQELGATFNIDIELNGVIDVEKSNVQMLGTKVEIKMKKAEPSNWRMLEYRKSSEGKAEVETLNPNDLAPKVEGVDLEDL